MYTCPTGQVTFWGGKWGSFLQHRVVTLVLEGVQKLLTEPAIAAVQTSLFPKENSEKFGTFST
jgi:hypothetical protein